MKYVLREISDMHLTVMLEHNECYCGVYIKNGEQRGAAVLRYRKPFPNSPHVATESFNKGRFTHETLYPSMTCTHYVQPVR